MKSRLQRPLLLSGLVFAVILVVLVTWIALGEGQLGDTYRP